MAEDAEEAQDDFQVYQRELAAVMAADAAAVDEHSAHQARALHAVAHADAARSDDGTHAGAARPVQPYAEVEACAEVHQRRVAGCGTLADWAARRLVAGG